MAETNFEVGTVYKNSSLTRAVAEDRSTPVQFMVLEDKESGIQGVASLATWDHQSIAKMGLYSNYENLKIGYLADLRISTNAGRKMKVAWRSSYQSLVDSLEDTILLTSVFDENTIARRALCSGRAGVLYKPVLSYTTLTLFSPPSTTANAENENSLQVKYRSNFNRHWKMKTKAGITEIRPFIITEVLPSTHSMNPEFDSALEVSVRKIWNENANTGQCAVQIASPSTYSEELKRAFQGWTQIATPATLYRVTSVDEAESTKNKMAFELTQRRILDISVL